MPDKAKDLVDKKWNLRSQREKLDMPPIPTGLDPQVAEYLTAVIRQEMQSLKDSVEANNSLLKDALKDISEIKTSLNDCSGRVDTIVSTFLPSLSSRITEIAVALAERTLDMDVHARKWSIIINGLQGAAGEGEDTTRSKCVKLAREIGVPNAESTRFSACHRLRHNTPNASVILRFSDLADREAWLSRAKHLPAIDTAISFSPDLPPVLRPLRNELLKTRRDLTPSEKRNTRVKYLAVFPYVELAYKDNTKVPVRPNKTKEQLLKDIIGFSPNMSFNFE